MYSAVGRKLSAKDDSYTIKTDKKNDDDDGAQWFEDAKKLPEIDSLQFVL